MRYTVEGKDTPRKNWKVLMRTLDKQDAIKMARDLDEHGSCYATRVMEHGHSDGMSRTVYTSIGG